MAAQIRTLRDMEYMPLPTGTNAIRLIRLMPRSHRRPAGISTDLVLCELTPTFRGHCPPYTAVSYAWGKNTTSSLLAIGKQIYEVSSTVEQVLRQLQAEDTDTFVWVDQVCINQQDDAEKSDQVQQMRNIYSEAKLVVAWLGPAADGSDMLLKHIESTGDAIWADDHARIFAAHSNEEGLQAISCAFRSLCKREYWRRLWIIQEFAVANSLRIACGGVMVWDWNLQALLVYMNRLLNGNHSRSGAKTIDVLSDSMPRAYITSATSFMEGVVTRRCRYWARHGDSDILFRVLVTTLVLEHDYNQPLATNPLDRIFSILHLAQDANEFVDIVDYSRTCEDIYREVALIILKQGHIDLLSYCQFPKEYPNIPTWTPDWRSQIRSPCTGPPWLNSFHASANTASRQCVTSPNQHTILLNGTIVSTIVECGSIWDPNWLSPLELAQTINYLKEVQAFCARSPRFTLSDEAEVAAAHIAIAACDEENGQEQFQDCVQAWREVMDYSKGAGSTENRAMEAQGYGHTTKGLAAAAEDLDGWLSSHWYTTRLRLLHARVPILSQSGHVGLVPSNAKTGDRICIFLGGKVPYIIRPSQDGSGTFLLVGEAYVYGIMHGELMGETVVVKPITLQ
ncbi:heterokaryon incompatibility protein-domain-containing protein [Fusarium solani]|uniref:Heterokaryon incompatibility protein-domain-containing protein n=1 Tax=Fusarium solani TaxID=169388 RepID=A0A9P9JSS2_FUSSL|nr:heterokaryon incompatibility protein-domain-containing protein [Fusarium solani]KAH7231986.1 heterokaryon incompatibility protein-domain-containing protein [Fusarium solani]